MNDDSGFILFLILVVGFCCGIGGCRGGRKDGRKDMQIEVVKRGYAEWKVAPDGSTEFAWRDTK